MHTAGPCLESICVPTRFLPAFIGRCRENFRTCFFGSLAICVILAVMRNWKKGESLCYCPFYSAVCKFQNRSRLLFWAHRFLIGYVCTSLTQFAFRSSNMAQEWVDFYISDDVRVGWNCALYRDERFKIYMLLVGTHKLFPCHHCWQLSCPECCNSGQKIISPGLFI